MKPSPQLQSEHHAHKIVLLGSPGIGKTTLSKRLRGLEPFPLSPSDHETEETTLDSDAQVSLVEILGETPEEEARMAISKLNPTIAIVVVMPHPERQHYFREHAEKWIRAIESSDTKQAVAARFLVSTRCDIVASTNRKQLEEIGRDLHFDQTFFVSSKTEDGIQKLRQTVLAAVRANDEEENDEPGGVAFLVSSLAESLCDLVAKHPHALHEIEWRDLERIIATALEKIGFSVELTPPAKDGGKDIVANCIVEGSAKKFYVEIKHWRSGDRPGMKQVSEFVEINAQDGTDGGLFLSSSGYGSSVHRQVGKISRQRVRLGGCDKIISLCQQYVKRRKGVWCPLTPLPELLFENTLN
jgi:GTPase SAR1 family protein